MTNRLIGWFVLALVMSLPAQNAPVIRGTVTDTNGQPVQGAVVSAILMSAMPPSLAPVQSVATDATGAYVFQSLPLGNYVFGVQTSTFAAPLPPRLAGQTPPTSWRAAGVFADRQHFVKVSGALPANADGTSLYDSAFYGGAATATAARLVQVDPVRPKTGIDITLKTVRAFRVSGVVTINVTQPPGGTAEASQVVVRLLPGSTSLVPRGAAQATPPVASAFVAPDGTFVFPIVPEGNYVLDAYRPFPAPEIVIDARDMPTIAVPSRIDGDPMGLAGARPLTVAGNVTDVRLMLRPSAAAARDMLQQQVPARGRSGGEGAGRGLPSRLGGPRGGGAISGKLTDADGAPLGGVQIHVAERRGTDTQLMGAAAITDADGTYRLGGIAPGRYVVVVPAFVIGASALNPTPNAFPPPMQVNGVKHGYVTTFYPAVAEGAQAEAIDVTAQERTGVDVVLQRRRVTDLRGTVAASRATNMIALLPVDASMHLGGRNIRRTQPTNTGEFVFADVQDGRYTLSVNSLNGWARSEITLPDAAAAGPLQVALSPYVTIRGRVMIEGIEDATGLLPPKLSVEVRPWPPAVGDGFSPAQVAPDGTFEVMRVVPGRTHEVRVTTTPPWRLVSTTLPGAMQVWEQFFIFDNLTGAILVITNR